MSTPAKLKNPLAAVASKRVHTVHPDDCQNDWLSQNLPNLFTTNVNLLTSPVVDVIESNEQIIVLIKKDDVFITVLLEEIKCGLKFVK